ncbi:MAG TPA: TetR/AcrR family transcriptional regulator [Egibacteraceae bacterium]|nr:TetR/AcrR family transcriptional regulator [Egibacteraceae bacterium]
MAGEAKKRAESRVQLSRQRVLAAAVSMADNHGLETLSMRGLARELGAGAMSLYYHVASKDDLLDAMIDVVFGEIDLPPTDCDWKAAIRQRALSARHVLARHPWAIGLMESRANPGPANVRHHEAVLATLRQAGFSVVMATHAYWILDSYLYGFALQETSLPFATPEELAEMTSDVYLPQIPADEYPYLNEAATDLIEAGYDHTSEFAFGLDLILDALEGLRPSV